MKTSRNGDCCGSKLADSVCTFEKSFALEKPKRNGDVNRASAGPVGGAIRATGRRESDILTLSLIAAGKCGEPVQWHVAALQWELYLSLS